MTELQSVKPSHTCQRRKSCPTCFASLATSREGIDNHFLGENEMSIATVTTLEREIQHLKSRIEGITGVSEKEEFEKALMQRDAKRAEEDAAREELVQRQRKEAAAKELEFLSASCG